MFQRLANWIKGWHLPDWLNKVLDNILTGIIIPIFKQLGEDLIVDTERLIIEASNKDITGREKLEYVVGKFREKYTTIAITDSMLNLVIELLVNRLKKQRLIG